MVHMTPKHFKTILVAVDDSPQGEQALAYAIGEAKENHAEKLVILSIFEEADMTAADALDLDAIKAAQAQIETNLLHYRDLALSAGVQQVDTLYMDGRRAGEVIVNEAIPATQADLVVVGAHSKVGFFAQIGSQAAYVAKKAPISVMVVRDND